MTDRAQSPFLPSPLDPTDTFVRRHLPTDDDIAAMLEVVGVETLDALVSQTVPDSIRMSEPLTLEGLDDEHRSLGEQELLGRLQEIARRNQIKTSMIGMGYYGCHVPGVIQRNILENPGWYTQYTPYQAEISQGRLEALLNFQTMVSDLTGLPVANASLLDEGTAAAEAMHMAHAAARGKRNRFVAAASCHPQTLAVLKTRADGAGIELVVEDPRDTDLDDEALFGILIQYPDTEGRIEDWRELIVSARQRKVTIAMATDLLALTLLTPPGELGAHVAIGSAQRFGVPLGFGGPHAAFLSTEETFKRQIPGRIIGVSKDARGERALRMAMQTREQHIRREKATSNICTAQVLLAIMAGCYGVYHGPDGLRAIARRVHALTRTLASGLRRAGHEVAGGDAGFFDTLAIRPTGDAEDVIARALEAGYNLRPLPDHRIGLSLDETTEVRDIVQLLRAFGGGPEASEASVFEQAAQIESDGLTLPGPHGRNSSYMDHEVFHAFHTEHEMLRYLKRLESRDLSLTTSMIPLGSCTMKLNATSEMIPVTWPEFGQIHPFAPADQTEGYRELFRTLEAWLASITGFDAASLQPNAGAQGEYAGLMTIRAFHQANNAFERDVCLIPISAHGTNPASAVMAGMKVVIVQCDENGNVDVNDLRAKAEKYSERVAALMVTYPSTHGVFETRIREICDIVHQHGGRVYLDGANMNAQVGLCRPGDYGADVCHLNLHKTFCIPHGGGGPGMGPICCTAELAPHLPDHPVVDLGAQKSMGAVSAAPWGSASILPISWVYIALMGPRGLTKASQVAILNANYMARRLETHYDVLYRGEKGRSAHEFILDLRPFKKSAAIEAEDVAKRLMDYGFHAPTMSFPVAGTLMIEPTESESKAELDRFCDAMISIRREIADIENGTLDAESSPLRNAPHTVDTVTAESWNRSYSRHQAAFPAPWQAEYKFWPYVARIDNAWGDRNLICTCPPPETFQDDEP
ncbi:MAG: aminomethyl-transferring glycine dehydrogenase [Thermoanaerobaculia bacterium]|nr:aminomethyl-transferring glycine dehydrogenase [Thermoanaerobaculia bacterium]